MCLYKLNNNTNKIKYKCDIHSTTIQIFYFIYNLIRPCFFSDYINKIIKEKKRKSTNR